MRLRLPGFLDPFLLLLICVPVIATFLPPRGRGADVLDHATVVAIAVLFFLHGAKLSPADTRRGFARWPFQLLVLGCTFVLFPVLGLLLTLVPPEILSRNMATGFLFLCILPSTVQSSIAFTSIARGNVALAVSAASISNVLGVVFTPLLAAFLLGSSVDITPMALVGIFCQLVVPFIAGQLLNRRLGPWLRSHGALVAVVDQGSVLLVVCAAFGIGVTQGLWIAVPPAQLLVVIAVCLLLLGFVLALFAAFGRVLRLTRGDRIVLVFCGSKKSQVSGLPMAFLLFPAATVGIHVLPLMVFHMLQLFVCAGLAKWWAARAPEAQPVSGAREPEPSGAAPVG